MSEAKEDKSERRKCPPCGSTAVRRSQMRGPWELILKLMGYRAYRCERCDRRHYEFRGKEVGREKRDK